MLLTVLAVSKSFEGFFFSYFQNSGRRKRRDLPLDQKNKKEILDFLSGKGSIDFLGNQNYFRIFEKDKDGKVPEYLLAFSEKMADRFEFSWGKNPTKELILFLENLRNWRNGLVHFEKKQNGTLLQKKTKKVFGTEITIEELITVNYPRVLRGLFRILSDHESNKFLSYFYAVTQKKYPKTNNQEQGLKSAQIKALERLLEYVKKEKKEFRRQKNGAKKKGKKSRAMRQDEHRQKENLRIKMCFCGRSFRMATGTRILNEIGEKNFKDILEKIIDPSISDQDALAETLALVEFAADLREIVREFLDILLLTLQKKQASDSDTFSHLLENEKGLDNGIKKNLQDIRNGIDHNAFLLLFPRFFTTPKDPRSVFCDHKNVFYRLFGKKMKIQKMTQKFLLEYRHFSEIFGTLFFVLGFFGLKNDQNRLLKKTKNLLAKTRDRHSEKKWREIMKTKSGFSKELSKPPHFSMSTRKISCEFLRALHAIQDFSKPSSL